MTGRILRVELHRSAALVSGALITLLGAAGLYVLSTTDQASLWDAQWTTLAVFQRVLLVVLWPLALGAGAWQARRDRRSRVEELFGTTARPAWQRVLPSAGALAIGLVLGYLAIFGLGAIRVAGHADHLDLSWLAITAVGALSVLAAGWLGLGIGRALPSVYTAPALVLVGFVLLLSSVSLAKYTPVNGPVGVLTAVQPWLEPIDEYRTIAGGVSGGQLVWFAGLALGGLVLAAATRLRGRLLTLLPIAAGLALMIPLVSAPAALYVPDAAATVEVCTQDTGPRVCVAQADAALLPTLTGPARRALALLARLPDPPTSVHEITGDLGQWSTRPQPAAVVWFASDNLTDDGAWTGSQDELTMHILAGAGTRPCVAGTGEPPNSTDARARAVAADWLYGSLNAPGPVLDQQEKAQRQQLWNTLVALPPAQQQQRITALRTAARACHGNLISALTGGAQ
jgi:hypothetical protein